MNEPDLTKEEIKARIQQISREVFGAPVENSNTAETIDDKMKA